MSALEIALLQRLVQKWKTLNLGPKMSDLRFFGLKLKNAIVIFIKSIVICYQRLRICLIAKFIEKKTKMPKFGIKNAFSG